jgi:hypothetical protein
MNEKADRILARREAAMEQGAAGMWRITIADTVMTMLDAGDEITRDTLLWSIEGQIAAMEEHKALKAMKQAALDVLNGKRPRD